MTTIVKNAAVVDDNNLFRIGGIRAIITGSRIEKKLSLWNISELFWGDEDMFMYARFLTSIFLQ